MKKWLVLILAATLTLSACGKSNEKASLQKDSEKLEKENKSLKKEKKKLEDENDKLKDKEKDLQNDVNGSSSESDSSTLR